MEVESGSGLPGIVFSCFLLGTIEPPEGCSSIAYCPAGTTNVACDPPPPTGGPACDGNEPRTVEMTPTLQDLIVRTHNTLRAKTARGQFAPLPTAARMPTLQWNDELATQAGHNVRSCVVGPDACANTKNFPLVGQNIGRKNTDDASYAIVKILEKWETFKEERLVDSYPPSNFSPMGKNFALIVNDRITKVGCAMQQFTGDIFFEHPDDYFDFTEVINYLVCNYSYSNVANQPVYDRGTTASGCTTGENPEFSGLCSVNEVVSTAS